MTLKAPRSAVVSVVLKLSAESLRHYKESGFSVMLNRFFLDYSTILYTMNKKAKKPVISKKRDIVHFNSIDAYFMVNNITK